jgi:hypothetical protein
MSATPHTVSMESQLSAYVQTRCLTDTTFDALFVDGGRHCLQRVFKLFDVCGSNAFYAPWTGQWITARQAKRLLASMYETDTCAVTPVTMSVLQFVLDWWNIRHVFGTEHPFNDLCGYPCMSPRQVPPVLGPRLRLAASDFAMVWCR